MSIFKIKQWIKLFNEWRTGQWIIDTTNEYTLCIVLFLLIPVWLIGIFFICHLFRPKISTANIVQKVTASHPFIPTYTPATMPSQGKTAVLPETLPVPNNTSDLDNSTQGEEQTDWVPKNTEEADALDAITQIAEENGLTPFPHVLLENELIPITISSDVDALLIKVLVENGTWQVGMTEPLEKSMWSCNGQTKNVLKEIVLGKEILSNMETEAKVVPVVVLAHGNIENVENTLLWLNQRGIEVVTLPENQQQGMLLLSDILVKYFGKYEPQEEENGIDQTAIIQEAPI